VGVVSLAALKCHAQSLSAYAHDYYLPAVVAYIALFVLMSACFIPVTVMMTLLGGYLFGGFPGALYATIGAALGGGSVFLLVRYFFRDRMRMRYAKQYERFNKNFKNSAGYLLFLQISPVMPTFFINVCMGLTNVPFLTYLWTAGLGMIPGSIIYAYAGEKLHRLKSLRTIMTPQMFYILLTVSCAGIILLYVRRTHKQVD
jgi:uncharacterized membrane protein YdjX (TVP38/TMEM64 family)